jgi:2-iminobutanoate/2-iminopropanoate deaminase
VPGTPGLTADGTVPADVGEESAQARRNVEAILRRSGAELAEIVSVRQWLTGAEDIAAYFAVRSHSLRHEPAYIPALVCGPASGASSK